MRSMLFLIGLVLSRIEFDLHDLLWQQKMGAQALFRRQRRAPIIDRGRTQLLPSAPLLAERGGRRRIHSGRGSARTTP